MRSGIDFHVVYELPRAKHRYKFLVDGECSFAPDQPCDHILEDGEEKSVNIIDLQDFDKNAFVVDHGKRTKKVVGGLLELFFFTFFSLHFTFYLIILFHSPIFWLRIFSPPHLWFLQILGSWEISDADLVYTQRLPDISEYTADAPHIPALLNKSPYVCVDPLPKSLPPNVPLHSICGHVYHDSGTTLRRFGLSGILSATTHRYQWKYSTTVFVRRQDQDPEFVPKQDINPLRLCMKKRISAAIDPVTQEDGW